MAFDVRREDYRGEPLRVDDLDDDPAVVFRSWLADAETAGLLEPSAMTLATADADGHPSARTVLLRGLDHRGFVFYTNLRSRKARELTENPRASLVFRWQELLRQVTVTGDVERVTDAEADAYFATRPLDSQLGAWASPQSQVIADRAELEARLAEVVERFGAGPVPRPQRWGGFRVLPRTIEFWQGQPARLHDRIRYRRDDATEAWMRERLAP